MTKYHSRVKNLFRRLDEEFLKCKEFQTKKSRADYLEVTYTMYRNYELGRAPGFNSIIRILEFCADKDLSVLEMMYD